MGIEPISEVWKLFKYYCLPYHQNSNPQSNPQFAMSCTTDGTQLTLGYMELQQ